MSGTNRARLIGDCDVPLWGSSAEERLRRQLARLGITEIETVAVPHSGPQPVMILSGRFVFDMVIMRALMDGSNVVLLDDEDTPVAAHVAGDKAEAVAGAIAAGGAEGLPVDLRQARVRDLKPGYSSALRKREKPYLMELGRPDLDAIHWRMFLGTYKGVTDFITKWVWPVPAFWATKFCARVGITPNAVTTLALVLVIAAFFFFLDGNYLLGLIAAWVMTFLDTVDGKLARVTLNSSTWGDIYDHGIDLIHPPFWWVAWALSLTAGGHIMDHETLDMCLKLIVGGYVLQRLIEGVFLISYRIDMHVWRPVDSFFRTITARRNPNLVILTLSVLADRPDWGLIAIAVWTGMSLVFHTVRLLAAVVLSLGGKPIASWIEEAGRP